MAAKTRNSSIELLRILCIFGIIFMHTIAYGGDELSQINRYLLIFANCFTNLGVTCFMLISGYFGVRFNLQKLIKLDLMAILYTILHQVIKLALGIPVGKMDWLSSFFPILSNQYWYLTAYFTLRSCPVISTRFRKNEKRAVREAAIILPFPVLRGADLPPF